MQPLVVVPATTPIGGAASTGKDGRLATVAIS